MSYSSFWTRCVTAFIFSVAMISMSFAASSPPPNDNLANAINLGSTATFTVSGDTTGATQENGEAAIVNLNGAGQTIWWKWTAPASQGVQLNTLNSALGRQFQVGVFTATNPALPTFATLALVVKGNQAVQFISTANTVYFIAVDTSKNSPQGPGGVNLNLPPVPANDNVANSTSLASAATFAITGDNTGATSEVSEVANSGFTVWYNWTAPATGNVRFNTAGSKTNHNLKVFTSSTTPPTFGNPSAVPVVKSTMTLVASSAGTSVLIPTIQGTVYYISVDSNGLNIGSFFLNLPPAPVNDNFANATDLQNQSSFKVTGDNTGATTELGDPLNAGGTGATIWWTWTAPFTQKIQIDTNGSAIGDIVSIYTGTALANLVSVTTNGNLAVFNTVSATQYFIRVDGQGNAIGAINLNLVAQANDNFANAQALSGPSITNLAGDNTNATKEPLEPNHGNDPGGASVWYTWVAPLSGGAIVSQTSASTNHTLAVYTGPSLSTLSLAQAPDPVSGSIGSQAGPGLTGRVTFTAVAGTVYQIAVDGQGGAFGTFTLSLSVAPSPPNDNFANSIALTGATFTTTGTTSGATIETGEPTPIGVGATVWYNWTPAASASVVMTVGTKLGGLAFNGDLDVFTGSAITALTRITSGNKGVSFNAVAGTTYQIRVDAVNTPGDFQLALLPVPPNDNFANSIQLATPTFDVFGYSFGATREPSEPAATGSNSVWWTWTAPANAHVAITLNGSDPAITSLKIFTGSPVSALTAITVNPNSSNLTVIFDATQNTAYQIAVGGGQGNIELALFNAPPNDNFANSELLAGPNTSANGDNFAATKEAGEPNHNGGAGGQSVWYNWAAPYSGVVNLSVKNASFNVLLGVYTGAAVNALTVIASGPGTATFTAVAGTVYNIAIDGNGEGTFTLGLIEGPPNDNFANAIALTGYTSTTGTNNNASKEPGEPDHAGVLGGKSVWWSWVAPDTRLVEVTTGGSNFNTLLAVYTGTSVSALTPIASNDDESPIIQTSKLQFNAVAGTTYMIAVDGSFGAVGNIALEIRRANVAITSPLSVSPSIQVATQPVTFVVATDAPAVFTWNFGDGSIETTTTPTINHVYAAAGNYTVTVTATEENGFSVSSTLAIVVLASRESTVAKLVTVLNFTKKSVDTISGTGLLYLPAGGSNSGTMTVYVGGLTEVIETFTLSNGAFKTKTTSFKLTTPKNGGGSKFAFKFTGDFQSKLLPLGLTNTIVKGKAINIPVQITFNGVSYEFTVPVLYSSTGKKGSAQ